MIKKSYKMIKNKQFIYEQHKKKKKKINNVEKKINVIINMYKKY
jgi:hypothetical protein